MSVGPKVKVDLSQRGGPLGDESSPWFWNPGLIGIQLAPEWFREKLHDIDKDLEVTWNRDAERWQVWVRAPRIQHRLCRGWKFLFPVQTAQGEYVPLDERTLAKIFTIRADQQGNGRQYFERVMGEIQRERELKERAIQDHTWYEAGQYWEHTQPRVGYGPISQSKVVGQ